MNRIFTKSAVLICAVALVIGMTSCETQAEKEAKAEAARIEAEKAAKAAQPAKYTITIGSIATTFVDVIAYECDDSGDRIHENECHFKWDGSHSKTFTAQPEAKKLKLYASFNNGSDMMTFGAAQGWVQITYPLRHGETTDVKIDGNTNVGRNMP